jgi:hypothetical protein
MILTNENFDSTTIDTLEPDNVLGDVVLVGTNAIVGVQNLTSTIRNKAKAKKAQGISNAGGYLSLTPFQKSLIPVPAYVSGQGGATGLTPNEYQTLPAAPITGGQVTKYIPYLLGAVVIGIAVYFIIKKK